MRGIIYTYIVPSKIRMAGFEEQIADVCGCQFVDRVIIINSDGKTYQPTDLRTGSILYEHRNKVMVVNTNRGTDFKNPAWNAGTFYTKPICNYFILASEFIRFDANVINLVTEQLEDLSNLGVLGVSDDVIGEIEDINYVYTKEVDECNDKFGTLMFVPKKKYNNIVGVKHIYGDKFIFRNMKDKGFKNYVLKSDTFRIKDNTPEPSLEERLQIALDNKSWEEMFKNKRLII